MTTEGPDISDTVRRKFQIKTFTGRFDPVEDRIRLDAVDAEGARQSIFLTHRLADKVIPIITQHLEGQTPEGIPSDLAQGMSQQRSRQARADGDKATPVEEDLGAPKWLCRTVHLTKVGEGLVIIFTDDAEVDASMLMAAEKLRVVLDIFRELYAKAGWSGEAFPEWMGAPDKPSDRPLHLN